MRCLISRSGHISVEVVPLATTEGIRRVGVARFSCKSDNIFLYHKTTRRKVYESAKSTVTNCDDVLLMNERGEITESTIANLVVEIDGMFITPPVSSGLLAGTFRGALLYQGEICEGIVTDDMIRKADAVWLINSVRKWMPVEFVD